MCDKNLTMNTPSHHVFVCTNLRPQGGRPACGQRGQEVLAALRTAVLRKPELALRVMVSATDCLGPCFDGPNLVIYPQGVWLQDVKVEEVDSIIAKYLEE